MKLLFVIDGLGPGGAQRQLVNLARATKSKGHEVEFFTYYDEHHYRSMLAEAGIAIHCFPKRHRFSIDPILKLKSVLRRDRFHAVVAFLDTPSFYAEAVRCIGAKTKLLVSQRFTYPSGKLPLVKVLLEQFHRLADRITVNSHHQRIRMLREFPWMESKLSTIYNGCDLNEFAPQSFTGGNNEHLRLLVVSSVAFKKNPLNLAKALKICRDRHNVIVDVRWAGERCVTIEGSRPAEETDQFLKLAGLRARWQWMGVRSDVPQLLASSDALIHPSFLEGLPNAVCEALACGRPVLASRIGDHSILVQDRVSGFLFDPNSPDDIARAIVEFGKLSGSERKDMERAARRYAEENLSVERYSANYIELIESLVNST